MYGLEFKKNPASEGGAKRGLLMEHRQHAPSGVGVFLMRIS
jgi:hypothetical protein